MPTKPPRFGPAKRPSTQPKPSSRPDGTRLYDLRLWRCPKRGLRIRVLNRDDWTCKDCGRLIYRNHEAHVDHIIPHRGDIELFQDEDNCETRCAQCHNRKTGRGA